MRASLTAGVFGMVLAAVGCGESDSGAGNKDQFIAQLCAEFAGCCEAEGRPSDGAQCRALYGAFVPASGYDQAAASACLDEIRASSDKCESVSGSAPSCKNVFAAGGTAKPGEACEDDADCAPSAEGDVQCVVDGGSDPTVQQCQVRLPGTEGSTPCVGTVEGSITFIAGSGDGTPTKGYLCDVADGLTCDNQTGACQALGAIGEACSGGAYGCIRSAYCDFSNTCKARLAPGTACQTYGECEESAYCDRSSNTCAARHAQGETCSMNVECTSDSCINQRCAVSDDLTLTFLCGN